MADADCGSKCGGHHAPSSNPPPTAREYDGSHAPSCDHMYSLDGPVSGTRTSRRRLLKAAALEWGSVP